MKIAAFYSKAFLDGVILGLKMVFFPIFIVSLLKNFSDGFNGPSVSGPGFKH